MTKAPLRLLATGVVVALAVAACGGGGSKASAPGVTATTVTIGSHQPLTGVAAPGYSEIAPASNAYFKYINANGGINGRTINYTYLDDGYNPANTVTVVHKLVEQDKVFAIFNGLGTPTHQAVVSYLNQQKVPDLFVASGCLCWNQTTTDPETFGWQPDYTVEGKILGQYIAKNFPGKKVGIFAQNDDFGTNGIKGLEDEIPASSVVSTQRYDPTNIKITPQVQALQQSGAEIVVSFSVPAFTALLKLTSVALKFNPQLVVSNVGSDPITLSGLISSFSKGKAPGQALIQGIISDTYLAPPSDASNSWIQLFKKIHDKYIPKLPFDGNVEYGMAAAYTFAQALKAAGKNPTRASIVAAVEKGGFSGPGLVPFAFSSSSHSGYTGVQIAKIQGLVGVPVGTPLVTDDTPKGAITPYTTAEPAAPSNGIPSD
ncbi:MAG TPA: ABC transporter substrate-binding protein [Mycobacteriales bacterium]|jgi:ABC-type branched-subunit amino acid transport system substrate-binding protein|nr:ABC transporter substrate-binding protein [Mycobacteriales bacterium]